MNGGMLVEVDGDARFRRVTFSWAEDDPANPASDVLVRLIPVAYKAHQEGKLDEYLMEPSPDSLWRKTLRLPADFRCSYQLCVMRGESIRGQEVSEERFTEVLNLGIVDPQNPLTIGPCTYGNPGDASILELPEADPQPWYQPHAHVQRGTIKRIELGTSIIEIYKPYGYQEKCPLVIMFDGRVWRDIDAAATLDNMIAAQVIPPAVVAFVESVYALPRDDVLLQHRVFLRFLREDLLPYLTHEYKVTDDPGQTVIGGQSFGGLAATYAGLMAPERFGLVLTQSGSFWRGRKQDEEIDAPEMIEAFRSGPKLGLRFYQEAGVLEGDLFDKNQQLHEVLVTRGYDITYREYQGGHDYACWRGGFADGLIALLNRNAA